MAISRILGASLVSDLDRQGIDLQFSTTGNSLVYMDFANFRLGVNTETPDEALDVVGNAKVSGGHLFTSANLQYTIGSIGNWWNSIYVGNIKSTSISGTLGTNSQPNITSLGTLTGLSINGNLIVIGYAAPSSNISGSLGNTSAWWSTTYSNLIVANNLHGTILTGNQPFITNLGNVYLNSLAASGNITAAKINANEIYDANNRVLTNATTILVTGDATGSGTYSNVALTLANTGVTAGVYGAADDEYGDKIPKITVDSKGRITNIANVSLTQIANVSFNDSNISANSSMFITTAGVGSNLVLQASGKIMFEGTGAVQIPYGDNSERPANPEFGYIRFNTSFGGIEYWSGSAWESPDTYTITSEVITPDGITNTFPLVGTPITTPEGLLVTINGTIQAPGQAYIISGNNIVFSEVPLTSDQIEVRGIASGAATVQGLSNAGATINLNQANVYVVGNVIPSVSGTYDIGVANNEWKTVYTNEVITSNINVSNTVLLGTTTYGASNTIVSSSAVATTIDSFDKTLYRTAKYLVQASIASEYESYEILVTHNSTTAYRTVYGVISTGNALGNISVTISSNNVLVQYTADNANTSVILSKTYLSI